MIVLFSLIFRSQNSADSSFAGIEVQVFHPKNVAFPVILSKSHSPIATQHDLQRCQKKYVFFNQTISYKYSVLSPREIYPSVSSIHHRSVHLQRSKSATYGLRCIDHWIRGLGPSNLKFCCPQKGKINTQYSVIKTTVNKLYSFKKHCLV